MRGGRVEDTSGMDCGDGNCQPLAGLGGFCVRWWVLAERPERSKTQALRNRTFRAPAKS